MSDFLETSSSFIAKHPLLATAVAVGVAGSALAAPRIHDANKKEGGLTAAGLTAGGVASAGVVATGAGVAMYGGRHLPVRLGNAIANGRVVGPLGHRLATAGKMAPGFFKGLYRAPGPIKAMGIVGAAGVGAGTVRAVTREDSYAAEDSAVSDNMGGYEAQPGPRERMAAIGATGDLVFGLHTGRR